MKLVQRRIVVLAVCFLLWEVLHVWSWALQKPIYKADLVFELGRAHRAQYNAKDENPAKGWFPYYLESPEELKRFVEETLVQQHNPSLYSVATNVDRTALGKFVRFTVSGKKPETVSHFIQMLGKTVTKRHEELFEKTKTYRVKTLPTVVRDMSLWDQRLSRTKVLSVTQPTLYRESFFRVILKGFISGLILLSLTSLVVFLFRRKRELERSNGLIRGVLANN